MKLDLNTPIWQLTVGEFIDLQKNALPPTSQTVQNIQHPTKRYVYGISGLAELFGCSKTTAGKWKAAGWLDTAIMQTGRKITIDAELALSLAGERLDFGFNK